MLDAQGNVVSGGRRGQRRVSRPKAADVVPAQLITKLGKQVLGLPVADARALVDEADPRIHVQWLDVDQFSPAIFRQNSIRLLMENDVVVDFELG